VELFGYARSEVAGKKSLSIVMEFLELGDLCGSLFAPMHLHYRSNAIDLLGILHEKAAKHPLSVPQRLRIARHCTLGIKVLHDHNIMHRDIKVQPSSTL
jgi:serine/threonine protein kinase